MSEEKRKYIRFGCLLPAEVTKVEDTAHIIKDTNINDFSREGIRVKMSLNLKTGSVVQLNIRHPKTSETIPVEAEIVWSRQSENFIELGLKISKIDKTVKHDIQEYIYEGWLEEQQTSGQEDPGKDSE
jgi:hypothetical protein